MTSKQYDKLIKENKRIIDILNDQNKLLFVKREQARQRENGQLEIDLDKY